MIQQHKSFSKTKTKSHFKTNMDAKVCRVNQTLPNPVGKSTLPGQANGLPDSQIEVHPTISLDIFTQQKDLGQTRSTIAKQCKSNKNKILYMKSLFIFLSFLTMLSCSLKASAVGEIPLSRNVHLTLPNEAVCFQTIDGPGHFLTNHPTNKVRFISHDANFSYSFSEMAIMLRVMPNSKKQSNPNMRDGSISNSILAVFEGINTECQLIGIKQADAEITAVSRNAIEIQACNYHQIFYTEIYPGIDLKFGDLNNLLQYEYLVMPGFDYKEIRFRFDGAKDVYINSAGQLSIVMEAGVIIEEAPQAEQEGKFLSASWVLKDHQVSLSILGVDNTKELRIQSVFHQDTLSKDKI